MATQQSANVMVTNGSDGEAWILLYHENSSYGVEKESWIVPPGAAAGPLTVHFKTGFPDELVQDCWSVLMHVRGGDDAGFYVSAGTWTECQLQEKDAGQTFTATVSATSFALALPSGSATVGMTKLSPSSRLTHVFVVVLENHSFDNLFAMSGIPGITAATTGDSNTYQGVTYPVLPVAPVRMPTDPGHEFPDTVQQLGGQSATYPPGGPYPPIDNSGFVANYATSVTEVKDHDPANLPAQADWGDVMACFATPAQLPVIHQLATEFALCDHWYSSLPGPTWPNRFFLHGASSAGLDASPTGTEVVTWETVLGFRYPNGSIYDRLQQANVPYRFYRDCDSSHHSLYSDTRSAGSVLGAVPQVAALHGVQVEEFQSLQSFAADLQLPYPYPYTFIEPHYGDITQGTYEGGSSQHPMDNVYGGESLLKAVYEAIRQSPYWDSSLLVITYDEHGGLYDSVAPGPAPAPADNPPPGLNQFGFNFEMYGVRVPAVVVSPLVAAGTVSDAVYDHTSVLATLRELFGFPALTARDAAARSVLPLLTLSTPRTDCPLTLASPAPPARATTPPAAAATPPLAAAQPLPASGNLVGALHVVKKTDMEMAGGNPVAMAAVEANFQAIQTRAQAEAYAASVMNRVQAARQQPPPAAPGTT